jgi:hypothetical protein
MFMGSAALPLQDQTIAYKTMGNEGLGYFFLDCRFLLTL